jgi:hypothetical protein
MKAEAANNCFGLSYFRSLLEIPRRLLTHFYLCPGVQNKKGFEWSPFSDDTWLLIFRS